MGGRRRLPVLWSIYLCTVYEVRTLLLLNRSHSWLRRSCLCGRQGVGVVGVNTCYLSCGVWDKSVCGGHSVLINEAICVRLAQRLRFQLTNDACAFFSVFGHHPLCQCPVSRSVAKK